MGEKTKTTSWECDGCGACCRQLMVEVTLLDVLREPKLRQLQPLEDPCEADPEDDTIPVGFSDPFLPGALLAAGTSHRCPFLRTRRDPLNCDIPASSCAIYDTRPNECVGFLAGSPKCQHVRAMEGLEPLQPSSKVWV